MNNNVKNIINITDRIRKVYNELLLLESNGIFNDQYYGLIDILKDLLVKENEFYSNLTDNEFDRLQRYCGFDLLGNIQEETSYIDKEYVASDNKDKEFINKDDAIERIRVRFSTYSVMKQLDDNNWYDSIKKGIYLIKNTTYIDMEYAYYYVVQSLFVNATYIDTIYNKNIDNMYKVAWKYLFIFKEPFVEKNVVNNDFSIPNDIEYIINLSEMLSTKEEYRKACFDIYDNYLRDICGEIIYGYYNEIDSDFLQQLSCIKSFLSIIDEESRKKFLNFSNDTLKNSGYLTGPCIDAYFDLYDESIYEKKKV